MVDSGGNEPRQIGPIYIYDKIIEILNSIGPLNELKLLDVPAGEGAFTYRLINENLGLRIFCGDINPEGFILKSMACDEIDLNKTLPYEAQAFDIFVCIEGIEHIENPFHLVREAHRILKANGRLILTTPNIASLRSRIEYLLYAFHVHFDYMVEPIEHINPISYIEIRHILESNGFRIEFVTTNRLLKRKSVLYNVLRILAKTRGKSRVRKNPNARYVRDALLTDKLLFGESLIVYAKKKSEL